jgi:hypothetical protein
MRKALAYSVAFASIILLLAVACAPARATTYTLGLTLGTTGTYSTSTTHINETGMDILVTWTNATALTLASTDHYSNGTVGHRYDTWDVRYGPGGNISLAFEWIMVVAANLNAGDQVAQYGTTATINSSTSMFVAGTIRTVNLWQLGDDLFVYWDKATGLMVKQIMNLGTILGWFNYTMIATNAWVGLPIPGYPLEAIGIALTIGVCTGLIYRRKHPQHASPP